MARHAQVTNYETELEEMQSMTRQEFIASLRRWESTHEQQWPAGQLLARSVHFLHVRTMPYSCACALLVCFTLVLTHACMRADLFVCSYSFARKSSGFSRGASIYRGVTRYINYEYFHWNELSKRKCSSGLRDMKKSRNNMLTGTFLSNLVTMDI